MPPGDAEDDLAEAVLLDVVAQGELEAAAHRLELVDGLGERRARAPRRRRANAPHLDHRRLGRAAALPRQRPPADVGQAAADHLRRVDVDHEQRLLEPRRPRDHDALVVDHARVAVEEELVLAADGVAEREVARVVARASDEHLLALALLADVERRRGDVRQQLRAGEREVGRRRPGLPHVLADGRADERLAEPEEEEVVPRREVAVLVEHAVVRQEALAVHGADGAVGEDEARVGEVAVVVRGADERDDVAALDGDPLHGLLGRAHEPGPQEQVLRRVAGDGELGEEDEVGALVACLGEAPDDPVAVPVEVADDGVDLGEREPHRFLPPSLKHRLPVVPTIDPRFNGPPGSGNGGYTCGLVAGLLGGPAEVTLRLPPPLGTPLAWDGERLLDGEAVVAEGRPADVDVEPPPPVPFADAEAGVARTTRASSGTRSPRASSAGPSGRTVTGSGSSPRRSRARDVVAAPWIPHEVSEALVWAALDCPGAIAVGWDARGVSVLGRMAAEVRELPRVGEPCVVVAQPLGEDGRKLYAATALYGEDGRLLGRARQTWITPRT